MKQFILQKVITFETTVSAEDADHAMEMGLDIDIEKEVFKKWDIYRCDTYVDEKKE